MGGKEKKKPLTYCRMPTNKFRRNDSWRNHHLTFTIVTIINRHKLVSESLLRIRDLHISKYIPTKHVLQRKK